LNIKVEIYSQEQINKSLPTGKTLHDFVLYQQLLTGTN